MPRNAKEYQGMPRNAKERQEKLRNDKESQRTQRIAKLHVQLQQEKTNTYFSIYFSVTIRIFVKIDTVFIFPTRTSITKTTTRPSGLKTQGKATSSKYIE